MYLDVVVHEANNLRVKGAEISLIPVTGGVIFGRYDKTTALRGSAVNSFNDVNQLLFVIHCPVYLVVITSSEINHDMFVTIEEHDGARIVQLVHLVEVRDLGDIYEVDDCEVLHFLCNRVEGLVHRHTLMVPVVAKANHDDTVLFRFDGFVNVPAAGQVWKEVGHRGDDMESSGPNCWRQRAKEAQPHSEVTSLPSPSGNSIAAASLHFVPS